MTDTAQVPRRRGRPPRPVTMIERFTMRMDDELFAELERAAAAAHLPVQAYMREAVRERIARDARRAR